MAKSQAKAKKAQKARQIKRRPRLGAGKKTIRFKAAKSMRKPKALKARPHKLIAKKAKKAVRNTAHASKKRPVAARIENPILETAKPPPRPSGAKYRFLEHTADIMVLAQGRDFSAALQQAGLAMFSVLGKAKALESFEIEETARSRTDLVVYVLARILSECDVHEMVPSRFDILEYDEKAHRLKAQVWGERIRPKDAIKAVTYHRLEVREEKGFCFIQVVFDV